MKLKRLNKRGFSLVEVIIAMAVVSIVTFAALSIIYPATDKTVQANAQSNAIYFASDAIECFKATRNSTEFFQALSHRSGLPVPPIDDSTPYDYPIDNKWKAIITLNYVTDIVTVDGTDVTVHNDSITIDIQSTDGSGKSLLDGPVTYSRKVAE